MDKKVEVLSDELRELGPVDGVKALQRAFPEAHLPKASGRPRADFSLDKLEKLAMLNPTVAEAAHFFGISVSSMTKRLSEASYREAWERGKAKTKRSLRAKQIEVAMQGDKTMLIWLGKQLLDQHDKPDVQINLHDRSEVSISMNDFEKLLDEVETEVIEAEWEPVDDGPDLHDNSDGAGEGEAEV